MAYALSAAMAVTVVPTYMMKPLVAEAAVNATEDKDNLISGDTITIAAAGATVDTEYCYKIVASDAGAPTLTATDTKVTCTEADKLTITVPTLTAATGYKVYFEDASSVGANATASSDTLTIIEHRVAIPTSLTEGATYTITDETNTGTTPYTTVAFFADGTTFSASTGKKLSDALYSTTFPNGQPTTINYTGLPAGNYEVVVTSAATSDILDSSSNCETVGVEITAASSTPTVTPAITADTVVSQGKTLGLSTAPAMYALYSSKDATAKPVYVLKKTNGSFDVPYDAPTGLFYIKDVSEKDEAYGSNENDYTIDIKAASPTTGISLSTTSSNVYYKGTAGSIVDSTNRETVAIKLSGADDANYKSLAISAKTGVADATATTDFTENEPESCGDFKITKSGDNLYVVMDKAPNTATSAGSDTLEITVSVSVVGRTNPFTKKITLKAVADTTAAIQGTDLALTADKSVIATNEVATVTAINKNIESKQNVYFALGSGADVEESTLVAKNGVLTLKDANKKVLATYDIDNGEFKAVKAGEYQVIMFVDGTTAPDGKLTSADTIKKALTINAAEFSIDTVAGKVSNTTSTFDVKTNDAVVTTFGGATLYASYTVEDPTIATVTGTSLEDAVVTFKKPGITKVTAEIKGYGNQEYNFTTTGYIVVAPKDDDDEFEITSIDNTELYANELSKATPSLLTDDLALQLADAVIDGSVNPSKLEEAAYSDAEDALYSDLQGKYDLSSSSEDGNVTVTGLLFAVYDSSIADLEDPESPVYAKLVVSDLQAKDLQYKVKDSVVNFVAEATLDDKVTELNQPVWLTVTDSNITPGARYTVYDNGEEIFTADAVGNTLTFQTDSFSVFSIVANPDGKVTNVVDGLDKPDIPDEPEDIYDKVNFSAHVQRRIGTDDEADIAATVSDDGIISLGTHGQSRRVEKITLTGLDADEVEMTAHVQKRVDHPEDVADLTQVVNEDGSISIGTEHQSRRIEAFSMNLKGDLAEKYDVYYRVHAQNYGWLGWAKNGEIAGTSGHSFRLEGIEIIFVEKGTEFDESQYVKTPEEGDRGYSEKAAYMDRVVSEK